MKLRLAALVLGASDELDREFVFPTGRAWADDLGYPAELANVPDAAVEYGARGTTVRAYKPEH